MRVSRQFVTKFAFVMDRRCKSLFLVLAATGILFGCVSKVQIPAVEQFQVASGNQTENIDAQAHGEILLAKLYQLIKANEGVEVPICTAEQDSRQCVKDGIGVFVFGGGIPGVGKRSCYVFSDISLGDQKMEFSKDNRGTKFIGTPMSVRANKCTVYAKAGGLQVEMTNYYANWAGVGNMAMAEGWAIDYMDFDQGVVGMQLELDIKGIFVSGGGSRYVLLKFPNIPDSFIPPDNLLKPVIGKKGQ